jgi:hypothetical protein
VTELEAIQAILGQWETGWDALHPQDTDDPDCVPYTYTNESFSTDQLGDLGAWARVSIIHTSASQLTQGSAPYRKWERRGNVFVQLFAPINQGAATLAELSDDVRTALEGHRLENLNLYEGRTEEVPDDGAWSRRVVVVRFRYVDTR